MAHILGHFSATILLNLMKRYLQIVAVVMVAILAAQPALAAMSCEMGTPASGHRALCCHKAMARMGMGCPMHHQVAAAGCEQNCCNYALPQGVAQLATGSKPKTGSVEFIAVAPRLVTGADAVFVGAPPGNTVAAAPARYILFQVFRI
jgi:hypothetical protein